MQHRATTRTRGRHRRTDALRGHRAPRTSLVLGERGRAAVVGAALVAGVGVAGVGVAATAGPASGHVEASRVVTYPGVTEPGDVRSAELQPRAGVAVGVAVAPVAVPVHRKTRPAPKVVVEAAAVVAVRWVNPMPEGAVTSCFGERWGRLHAGVDLATASGTPIHAVGAGVVVAAGPAQGYGNAVLIDHGNGYLTHYGHMSAITVAVGQHVGVGQQIGNEGSTGHSTGPHLHFEVHRGTYKNPIEPTRWLHEHGVDIPGCVPLGG